MTISYMDTAALDTYVHACVSRAGLSVKWDEPGSIPRTDGTTVFVPRLTSKSTIEDVNSLKYAVSHEVSHLIYTNFAYYAKVKRSPKLAFVMNILEDNRIDYLNQHEYIGDRLHADVYYTLFGKKVEGPLSEHMQALYPLFRWDADFRGWIPSAAGCLDKATGPSREALERLAKLRAGTYGERMEKLRITSNPEADLVQLARDILKDIYGIEEKEEEQEKGEEQEKENPADEEGKAGEGTEGEPTKGVGDGEPFEGFPMVGDDHMSPPTKRAEPKGRRTPTGRGEWQIPSYKDYEVILPESGTLYDLGSVRRMLDGAIKPLTAKLRHKLQVQARSRYQYGQKKGKLHGGSLHRLITGKGTELERRVFTSKVVSDTLDTAVTLLIDCSGSMLGPKYSAAAATAAAVAEALRPLHIPYAINGFSNPFEGDKHPRIFRFSQWGESAPLSTLLGRLGHVERMLRDNSDGDALAFVANELLQRREKRRIMIVLSDGDPSGRQWAGDLAAYTKEVCQAIEKKAELYGIGIFSDSVETYYTNHVVLRDTALIAPTVLSILNKI